MGTTYTQLSITERRRIERWRHAKVPVDEMARVLKRCRSTIFRELKRNYFSDESMPKCDGYYGAAAHLMQADRRARDRKLIKHPELCKRVIERIKDELDARADLQPNDPRTGNAAGLPRNHLSLHLLQRRHARGFVVVLANASRRAQTTTHPQRREPKFHRDVSILFRPDDVAHRRQFGHWEGDLMLFKQKLGQANVTSLVKRVSRFTVILKNLNRRSKPVMGKIITAIKDLPHQARRAITFDRGSEFMNWPHLQAEIGTQTWFCDPSSPWQKGTVENTNRRARRWLPRKRDIRSMTDQDMKEICDRLNNTPRKCLDWKTPAEVFREKMMEEMR